MTVSKSEQSESYLCTKVETDNNGFAMLFTTKTPSTQSITQIENALNETHSDTTVFTIPVKNVVGMMAQHSCRLEAKIYIIHQNPTDQKFCVSYVPYETDEAYLCYRDKDEILLKLQQDCLDDPFVVDSSRDCSMCLRQSLLRNMNNMKLTGKRQISFPDISLEIEFLEYDFNELLRLLVKQMTTLMDMKVDQILTFTKTEVQEDNNIASIDKSNFKLLRTKFLVMDNSFVPVGPVYMRKDLLQCMRIKVSVEATYVAMVCGDFGQLIFHLSHSEADMFIQELSRQIIWRKGVYFRIEYEDDK